MYRSVLGSAAGGRQPFKIYIICIYIFVYVTCIRAHNQQENTHFQLSDMAFAYNTEKLARIAGPLHGHVLPVGS